MKRFCNYSRVRDPIERKRNDVNDKVDKDETEGDMSWHAPSGLIGQGRCQSRMFLSRNDNLDNNVVYCP